MRNDHIDGNVVLRMSIQCQSNQPNAWSSVSPPTLESVGSTSASISASLTNGAAGKPSQSVSYWMQYGTTSASYPDRTSAQTASVSDHATPESMTIGGLQPSTTYHYRVVAECPCDGITNYSSEDQTFTTGPSGGVLRASAKRPVATTLAPAGATGLRLTAQRSGRNPVRLRPADHTAGQAWTITRPGAGLAARLVNAGSGLCLGVHRWSHGARAAVVAEACRKRARSQQWTQLRLKGDQWRFVNRRTHGVLSARLSSRGVGQRAGRRGADEAWTVRRRAG